MNFFQAIRSGLQNYAVFSGRAIRSEFWYFILFMSLAGIIAQILDAYLFPQHVILERVNPISVATTLGLLLPWWAVSVRRLHDIDRTGWWLLLYLTLIGTLWLFYWACRPGTPGPNRFEAARVARLNGWQRLWLVASAFLGLWFVGIWPFTEAGRSSFSAYQYRKSLEEDFRNPQCRIFQTAPIETLQGPPWTSDGGSCWHIYTARKRNHTVPYTLEVFDRMWDKEWRNLYLTELGIGAAITIITSAVVYFLGWLVGWILRRFKKAKA